MRVGIRDRNTHRSLEACFAVPMIGATLVTLDPRVTAEQLRRIQHDSGLHLLLASSEFVPMVCEALAMEPVVPRLITMGRAGDFEMLLSTSDASFKFPFVEEDAEALHLYRTNAAGCTERQTYTHRQLVNDAQSLCARLVEHGGMAHVPGNDVYLHILPLSERSATSMPYAATMLGIKQVYPDQWDTSCYRNSSLLRRSRWPIRPSWHPESHAHSISIHSHDEAATARAHWRWPSRPSICIAGPAVHKLAPAGSNSLDEMPQSWGVGRGQRIGDVNGQGISLPFRHQTKQFAGSNF